MKRFTRIFLSFMLVAVLAVIAIPVCAAEETADFTMTEESLNIPGLDLLLIDGCFTYDPDPAVYTRGPVVVGANDMANVPDEAFGQILLHGGKGDTYTFTVDFGEFSVDTFGFYSYGAALEDTVVGLSLDGEQIGSAVATAGNGWADADPSVWNYNEIEFEEAYSGVHTVTIQVLESAPAWPANVFGNFLFLADTVSDDTVADTTPETVPATEPESDPVTEPVTEPETAPVTEEETVESKDTNAVQTDAVTTEEASQTEATTENGGCGSVMGASVAFFLMGTAAVALIIKKRDR